MAKLACERDHLVVVLRIGVDDPRETEFLQKLLELVERRASVGRERRQDHRRAVEESGVGIFVAVLLLAGHGMSADTHPARLESVFAKRIADESLHAGRIDHYGPFP